MSVCSSRLIPRKPTVALGSSFVIPSSMPRPALRIGTMIGLGFESFTPWVVVTGVSMVIASVLMSLVAS